MDAECVAKSTLASSDSEAQKTAQMNSYFSSPEVNYLGLDITKTEVSCLIKFYFSSSFSIVFKLTYWLSLFLNRNVRFFPFYPPF